jgi:GNAT superfamily N-acetyltransferase
MDLRQFGPDDASSISDGVRVRKAVRAVDSPWQHPSTDAGLAGELRYGWDLEPDVAFLVMADDEAVGFATYSISEYDNLHLAWLDVEIHPEHRRRGHGSEALAALIETIKALGRTSIGIAGWDGDGPRAFAAHHGFELASVAVNRRQYPLELDWPAIEQHHEAALERAQDYELVRRTERTPDDELAALAEMTAAINDAPTDDLDIEDNVFTPARVRDYETAQLAQHAGFYRVYARRRSSGELAGQTVVAVDANRPGVAEQHDTSVLQAHRGHRLGLLLKSEMVLWLRAAEPQLKEIDTWNAESNDFMIGVNELLGYRIMGRELAFQKTV